MTLAELRPVFRELLAGIAVLQSLGFTDDDLSLAHRGCAVGVDVIKPGCPTFMLALGSVDFDPNDPANGWPEAVATWNASSADEQDAVVRASIAWHGRSVVVSTLRRVRILAGREHRAPDGSLWN